MNIFEGIACQEQEVRPLSYSYGSGAVECTQVLGHVPSAGFQRLVWGQPRAHQRRQLVVRGKAGELRHEGIGAEQKSRSSIVERFEYLTFAHDVVLLRR